MIGKLIIILGYTLTQNGSIPPILHSRLEKGISLYEPQDTILVSGYTSPRCLASSRCETPTQAEAMKQYLIQRNIPEENIIKEERSTTTFGNAFYAEEFLERLSPNQIVIVTNEFHHASALYCFTKVLGTHYTYTFALIPDSTLDIPSAELERWRNITKEMATTYYPMLCNNIEDGDREKLNEVIEYPPLEFQDYVRDLLKLSPSQDLKELISG